jgi:hypothetical protein
MPDTEPLPGPLAEEVRRTLHDLRSVRLASQAWTALAGDIARLDAAVERGDEPAVRAALVPVSQAAFEGKVRGRLAGTGTRAPAVVPTKRSAALPVVGVVCGALILGLGYLIGGTWVLAGSAAFALFIFVVALAGSRVTASRARARQDSKRAPTAESVYPPPRVLRDAVERIEASLPGSAP